MIEAVLELESRILKGDVRDRDLEIEEISNYYNVKGNDLEPYFDLLESYRNASLNSETTINNRVIWNSVERKIIDYYVKNTNFSKTEQFNHLSRILSLTKRTKGAISFDYYNNIAPKDKDKEKKKLKKKNMRVAIQNKANKEILLEDEVLVDNQLDKSEKVDFLSNLSVLINNAKSLSNFNLEEFFEGLTLLSSLAVDKTNESKELEELRRKVNVQSKIIEGLNNEISNFNNNISNISNDIIEFSKLDGIDKIGNLENFINKLCKQTNCLN